MYVNRHSTPVTVPFTRRCFTPACLSDHALPPHKRHLEQSITTSPSAATRRVLLSRSGARGLGPAQFPPFTESRAASGAAESRSVHHAVLFGVTRDLSQNSGGSQCYDCRGGPGSPASGCGPASPKKGTAPVAVSRPTLRARSKVAVIKLARRALLLPPAALTPSGRLQLLPHEAEVRYGDKVDAEFPEPGGGLAGDTASKYTARR